jgi:hypothetical protein
MALCSKTNNFKGPPSTTKLTNEPSSEGELESELIDSDLDANTDCVLLFINESKLGHSPHIEIKICNKIVVNAILDSGSEVNLLSEEIYGELSKSGLDIPVLPVENVLVTAFGRKSKRIRQQALINFTVGLDSFESVFLISSQLTNEAIIGCRFLMEYGIRINFDSGTFSYVRKGILKEQAFCTKVGLPAVRSNGRRAMEEFPTKTNNPQVSDLQTLQTHQLTVNTPPQPEQVTAVLGSHPTRLL